ncbi:MAG: hypothetical protein WCI20_11775, partial [bacterium]
PVNTPSPVPESIPPPIQPINLVIAPNTDISKELKRLWEKATPSERRAFLESMTPPPCEFTKPVPAP